MPENNRHIVLKSILEINLPGGNNDTAVLEEVRERFYSDLLPVMEKIFDEVGGGDRHIRLEQLQVDLGELEDISTSTLVNRFEQVLRQQLNEKASKMKTKAPDEEDRATQEILWFLEYGTFPWWSSTSSLSELENEFLSRIQQDKSFVKHLEVQLSEDKSLQRFIFSVSQDFLEKATPILVSNYWKNAEAHYRSLNLLFKKYQEDFREEPFFRAYVGELINLKLKLNTWDLELLTERVLWAYFRTFVREDLFIDQLRKFHDILLEMKGSDFDNEEVVKMLSLAIDKILDSGNQAPKEKSIDDWIERDSLSEEGDRELGKQLVEDLSKRKRKLFGDEHYVDNAGLVLLYPYLAKLFREIQILDQIHFRGISGMNTAVILLHYMVWKEKELAESKMLLNKILCGLPEDFPVNVSHELLNKEKDAAEIMLKAAIINWKLLKNTSPGGLRESFLQRDGVLHYREEQWKLIIDRKTIDLLVDKLPYPLSMIKLPWMEVPLSVEW